MLVAKTLLLLYLSPAVGNVQLNNSEGVWIGKRCAMFALNLQ